jgi:hypothetical protein
VTIDEHTRERLETRRPPEVVTTVSAGVEQRDEDVRVKRSGIDDPPDTDSGKLLEGLFDHSCGDAVSEQRGGHEPSLNLGVTGINIDTELGRIAAAESADDGAGES